MKPREQRETDQKSSFFRDIGRNFALDPMSSVPFYRQIIQTVETNIASGRLEPGDQLPTIRTLAIALKINPNTIAKAYVELEIRGLVHTQVGVGTFISSKTVDLKEERLKVRKKLDELCLDLVRKAGAYGADRDDLVKVLRELPIDKEDK